MKSQTPLRNGITNLSVPRPGPDTDLSSSMSRGGMRPRFLCPMCLNRIPHVFRRVSIRQLLIMRPGGEVRSVRDALDG